MTFMYMWNINTARLWSIFETFAYFSYAYIFTYNLIKMYPSYCFDNDYIKTTSRWRESSTHFFCKCGMLLIGKHGVIDVSMTRKAAAAAVHLKGSLAGTCRDHCTGGHRFATFATQRRAPDPDFRSVTVIHPWGRLAGSWEADGGDFHGDFWFLNIILLIPKI